MVKIHIKYHLRRNKVREVLDSSFEDLPSDDESVYNTYWEEFEEREKRKVQRSIDLLHDPMILLEKLQGYSKNLYKNLTPDDKNQLLRQIEKFLDEGVTPLQKYYDELRTQFSVPSKNLINFEKKEFRKQLEMIRRAQKKELEQVKYMATVKAKNIVQELIETANITVKKEMTNIVRKFNEISSTLYERDQAILKKDRMLKDQEKEIIDLRLSLFQSVSQQALESDKVDKMYKYLNKNLTAKENDINDTIKLFLKKEKPIEEIIDCEPFMKNPFNFYSSYISLSLRDKEAVVRGDLVRYYNAIIDELKNRVNIREKEYKASSEMNSYYMIQLNQMSDLLDERNLTIENLLKDLEYDKNRYEKVITDMNTEFHHQKINDKKENLTGINLLFTEIQVREKIQQKMFQQENELKEEILALKQILMVPRLHYKYLENKKLEDIKKEREVIVKTEIGKIVTELSHPKSTKNTYKSLPRPKRTNSSKKKNSMVNNFGFGDRNRKMSQFMMDPKNSRSPSKESRDMLPNILNKTTDSTITTTMRSFRYDRSSPALDMSTILSTSNNSIIEKRKNGNSSQIQISKSNFM